MPRAQPSAARVYGPDDLRPKTSWAKVVEHLEEARTFWLATARADGRPHVMPLLAVCIDGDVYFCAGAHTQKARNLARDARCALTTATEGLDVVVEGTAAVVTDPAIVERAAAAYMVKYGWDAEPRDGAFHGEGAPTAGPPPLDLYRVLPATAFAFGTDESSNATRWRFG